MLRQQKPHVFWCTTSKTPLQYNRADASPGHFFTIAHYINYPKSPHFCHNHSFLLLSTTPLAPAGHSNSRDEACIHSTLGINRVSLACSASLISTGFPGHSRSYLTATTMDFRVSALVSPTTSELYPNSQMPPALTESREERLFTTCLYLLTFCCRVVSRKLKIFSMFWVRVCWISRRRWVGRVWKVTTSSAKRRRMNITNSVWVSWCPQTKYIPSTQFKH